MKPSALPICVDLDGTLLRSDLLVESTLNLLRHRPAALLFVPLWLLKGKAYLKRRIAESAPMDVASLPYDPRMLERLRSLAEQRPRILCTASDASLAQAVSDYLECFDQVMASDGKLNLSGQAKANALISRFGEKGFDYAGNENRDLHVWRAAHSAWVVNAPQSLADKAARCTTVALHLPVEGNALKAWSKALRMHQWTKNLLIFIALLAAHQFFNVNAWTHAILGFIAFSLCASSVYIVNDLLDLSADRQHPRKRTRPFASGALPIIQGIAASPLLLIAGLIIAFSISLQFCALLVAYTLITHTYSLTLKRVPMLDVIVLAGLYTLRIIAGAIAIEVPLSFWLLAFSMFLFLSLAMIKRYTELRLILGQDGTTLANRGYAIDDLPLVQSMGAASGYLSVLVLALYINNQASEAIYRHPKVMWLICPLMLYWISRAWLKAHRGQMNDDPVVYALKDKISLAVVMMVVSAFVLAI